MVLLTLVALVILMVAIVYFISFFSEGLDDVFVWIGGLLDADAIKSPNRAGNVVCDMTFTLFGAFDETGFGFDLETQQRLYLGQSSPSSGGAVFHPEVAEFFFRPNTCIVQGDGINLFSLIPTFSLDKLSQVQAGTLAITNLTDLTFQVEVKFVRIDDRTVAKTKVLTVNEGALSPLPKTFTEKFSVDNIEVTNYDVEITCSGDCSKVNQLSAGQPFIYKIRI